MTFHAPPRLVRWMMESLTSGSAEGLVGDLEEEFHLKARAVGTRRAGWWYRRQVAVSFVALLWMGIAETNLRLRSRAAVLGVLSYVASLFLLYAAVAVVAGPGARPLQSLHPILFLLGWVFGGAAVGGFVGGSVIGSGDRSGRSAVAATVGVSASLLLLLGLDEPLTLAHQTLLSALAVSGALVGAVSSSLAARRYSTLRK